MSRWTDSHAVGRAPGSQPGALWRGFSTECADDGCLGRRVHDSFGVTHSELRQLLVFSGHEGRIREMSDARRRRAVIAVRRGVFAPAKAWAALRPYQRNELRVHAASVMLDDPIFALESAAIVHGLPVFGEVREVHTFAPDRTRGYRHGTHVVHASADAKQVDRVDGIRATSLADTTVDLLRVLPHALGVALLDAAIRKGLHVEQVAALLAAQSNRRGRSAVLRAVAACDARAESVLESISRVIIDALGYPPPELQVAFRLPTRNARTDFFWRAQGIVGEADGNAKYFGGAIAADEVIREERGREMQLRRLVTAIARWGWSDVLAPSRLDGLLQAVGLHRIRPAHPRPEVLLSNSRTRPGT